MTEMQADLHQLVQISEVCRKPASVLKTVIYTHGNQRNRQQIDQLCSYDVCVLILRKDWHCTGGLQSIWTLKPQL